MDTLAWQPCSDKDVESCRKYVKQYLHGLHDKGAREKITESEFEQAKAQDTIEGYEKFLGQHPNHAPALARLRDLLYERATSTGELADWQKFREWNYVSTSYEPASKDRLAYALKEIERLMYAEIVAGATLKECQEYLSRYREGVHAQQVRVALDPLLFENAKKANTIRDYKEYLQEYPQGPLTTEAQSLVDPLLFEWDEGGLALVLRKSRSVSAQHVRMRRKRRRGLLRCKRSWRSRPWIFPRNSFPPRNGGSGTRCSRRPGGRSDT